MGGCRCTYLKCRRASDSVTHFFHYPVKDEERCLVWLQNAQRMEFQKLSKMQIKNKVICQYHFEDNMFMNYRHDRLVPRAVPMSSQDEPPEALAKTEDLPIVFLETDVKPSSKEESTMVVNTSTITGLSFIAPHEKRSKHNYSYVELLTRQHTSPSQNISAKTSFPNKQASPSDFSKSAVSYVSTSSSVKTKAKAIPTAAIESSVVPQNFNRRSTETVDSKLTIKTKPLSTVHTPKQLNVQEVITVPPDTANSACLISEIVMDTSELPNTLNIADDPNTTQMIEITVPSYLENYQNCPSVVQSDTTLNDLFRTPPKTLRNVQNLPRKRKLPLIIKPENDLLPIKDNSINEPKQNSIQIVSNEPFAGKDSQIESFINRSMSLPTVKSTATLESNAVTENQINVINKQLLEMFEKKKAKIAATSKTKSPEKKRILSQNRSLNNIDRNVTTENVITASTVQFLSKPETPVTNDIPVNECIKMIHENSKEIAELKRMLLAQKTEKSALTKSRSMNTSKKMSKSYLFTHLVPYLSPQLAQMVHKEMFPLLARK